MALYHKESSFQKHQDKYACFKGCHDLLAEEREGMWQSRVVGTIAQPHDDYGIGNMTFVVMNHPLCSSPVSGPPSVHKRHAKKRGARNNVVLASLNAYRNIL